MRARAGLIAIVVVAGLIAAFLYFDLKPRRPNLPAYHYGERTSADYQAGGANCEPHALASIRDNRKAAMQRKHCAEAVEEHRLKSEDLVQQARAADAAQVQAATNYDLARMALWGTIGGFLTLIAAAIAAYFAREAAATAGEHLRHAANESRPFLIFGPLRLELDTRRGMFGQWGAHFELYNRGQMPARIVLCETGVSYRRVEAEMTFDPIEMRDHSELAGRAVAHSPMEFRERFDEHSLKEGMPRERPPQGETHMLPQRLLVRARVVYRGITDGQDVNYVAEIGRFATFTLEFGGPEKPDVVNSHPDQWPTFEDYS